MTMMGAGRQEGGIVGRDRLPRDVGMGEFGDTALTEGTTPRPPGRPDAPGTDLIGPTPANGTTDWPVGQIELPQTPGVTAAPGGGINPQTDMEMRQDLMDAEGPGVAGTPITADVDPSLVAGVGKGDDWAIPDPTQIDLDLGALGNIDMTGIEAPTQTGAEFFQGQYPEAYTSLIEQMTAPQQAYTYDPTAIGEEFSRDIFDPAMQDWREDVAPWLREQFVSTGNVLGSEMPNYLARQATSYARGLQPIRAQMLSEGRALEASAIENMNATRNQALNTWSGIAALPAEVGFTQAQTDAIRSDIKLTENAFPATIQKALADIDFARASTASIYDKMSGNPLISDSMAIENMVNLAYMDSMAASTMGQEIQNIGYALENAFAQFALGEQERDIVQQVLSGTYNDWAMAVGEENLLSATNMIRTLLGMDTIENVIIQGL